jgi:hypothetical protein
MLTAGTLRACWSLGLAFIRPGVAGIILVIAVQLGLVTCCGVFNPVYATYRLDQTEADRVARTLSAWSVTSNATIAALTALWGLLAAIAGPRAAIAIVGLLMLATPLLLLGVAAEEQEGRARDEGGGEGDEDAGLDALERPVAVGGLVGQEVPEVA